MDEVFMDYNAIQVFWHKSLFKMNDLYRRFFGTSQGYQRPIETAQDASEQIGRLLSSDNPCMIARFGSTELYCVSNYLSIRKGVRNVIRFIQNREEPWWWIPERVYNMRDCSGFFPLDEKGLSRFCEMILEDSVQLDLLGSWLPKEERLKAYIGDTPKVFLPHLEPWYAEQPWTALLSGRKVLVVHPFAEQIRSQYKRRDVLFDRDILPLFDIKTIKAVQSLGGNSTGKFHTWFDALDGMKEQIDKVDYDICLIGCGAYGFSLAAHVKRQGKKAFHLGGALQLLFGIKGNRWEDPMYGVREWGLPYNYYPTMFNQFWEKPWASTKPENAEKVENACYW